MRRGEGPVTEGMLHRAIYKVLKQVAEEQRLTTYSDIAPMAALDMENPAHRDATREILGKISTYEHQNGRPMLTAVVVHKQDGRPGDGFFDLAQHLGLMTKGGNREEFFVRELRRVHQHWKPSRQGGATGTDEVKEGRDATSDRIRLPMNRLYIPTLGPTDWRRLLADPSSQWERFKSALEMAVCWEAARGSERGLPPEIRDAIDTVPELRGAYLLIGLPEHKVQFEGGGHPSQNDLWALLRARLDLISLAVEAKAGEPLDDLVRDWLLKKGERSGKPERLAALRRRLGIDDADVSAIRYQLLHRTASALYEAERFGAQWAVVLVQSFDHVADKPSWQDFIRFGELMGVIVAKGRLVASPRATAVPLYLGWVTSPRADLERLSAAV